LALALALLSRAASPPSSPVSPHGSASVSAAFRCGDDLSAHTACACFSPGTPAEYVESFRAALEERYESAYAHYGRWSVTATDGLVTADGVPITLTYSFVPDFDTGDPATSNCVHEVLDGLFGDRATWKALFREMFDTWSAVCGVTFVEVSDDGADWEQAPGALGARGDIRFVSFEIDGPYSVLAYATYPNYGDIALDRDENWAAPDNDYRFLRNVVLHELGHTLGLKHTLPQNGTKLMEAYYTDAFVGPQDDDIRGAVRYYGDEYELNNVLAAAVDAGAFAPGRSIGDLALHDAVDVDWFAISAAAGTPVAVRVAPVGGAYSVGPEGGTTAPIDTRAIHALAIELFDDTGTELLRSAEALEPGESATTSGVTVPAGGSGFLARVTSNSDTDDVQRYELVLLNGDPTKRALRVLSNAATEVEITISPADDEGTSTLVPPADLTYTLGTTVTLTAPAAVADDAFEYWLVGEVAGEAGANQISVTLNADLVVEAVYGVGLTVDGGEDRAIVVTESIQLYAEVSAGTPPYTYFWSPGATLSATDVVDPVARPLTDTTYTVTVQDADGQTASDTITVTVLAPLFADAGADQYAVIGRTFELNGAAAGGEPPYALTWSPDDVLEHAGGARVRGSVTQDTEFTLEVIDAQGRTATDTTLVRAVAPLSVRVAGADPVLRGGSVLFTATAIGGVPPYSFTWSPAGEPFSETGSSVQVTPTATTYYSVTVSDVSGQMATAQARVIVVEPLAVEITVSASPVLKGESATLTASVTGGLAPLVCVWSPADGLSTTEGLSVTATPEPSTTYTATVTDSLGQSATAAAEIVVEDEAIAPPRPVGGCGAGLLGMTPFMLAGLWPLRRLRRCVKQASSGA